MFLALVITALLVPAAGILIHQYVLGSMTPLDHADEAEAIEPTRDLAEAA
jgi:hypothetical protein